MSWLYDKLRDYRDAIMYSSIPAIFAISTIGALSGKNETIKPAALLEERVAKEEKKAKKTSPVEEALRNQSPENVDWEKISKGILKLYVHKNGNVKMIHSTDLIPSQQYSRRFSEYDKKRVQEIIDEYYNCSKVKEFNPPNAREGISYWRATPSRATYAYEFEVENNRVITVHHIRAFTIESKSTYDLIREELTIQPFKALTASPSRK